MGAWLQDQRRSHLRVAPWLVFGEGPTRVTSSALNTDAQEFTPQDIRFTTRGGVLYAIALGWPAGGELRIRSLARGLPYFKGPICGVKLLGSSAEIHWRQDARRVASRAAGTAAG